MCQAGLGARRPGYSQVRVGMRGWGGVVRRGVSLPLTTTHGDNEAQRDQDGSLGDFPGRPVVKTPHFHCRGCGFNPWSGN